MTKYAHIADDLARRITSGEFAVGDGLPTEASLGEQYEASRFTVREALRHLEQQELIVRRQGSGSRVARTASPTTFTVRLASEVDILRYAQDTTLEVARHASPIPDVVASLAGLGRAEDWSWFTGTRTVVRTGQTIGLVDLFLRADLATSLQPHAQPVVGAIFQRIGTECGEQLDRIEQHVAAVALSSDVAGRLDSDPGSPGLRIIRRFFSRERLFEVSITVHPADRFEYSLELKGPAQ
jgi:GntR family transcriptional regulator